MRAVLCLVVAVLRGSDAVSWRALAMQDAAMNDEEYKERLITIRIIMMW